MFSSQSWTPQEVLVREKDFCGLICKEWSKSNLKNVMEEFGELPAERSAAWPLGVSYLKKMDCCQPLRVNSGHALLWPLWLWYWIRLLLCFVWLLYTALCTSAASIEHNKIEIFKTKGHLKHKINILTSYESSLSFYSWFCLGPLPGAWGQMSKVRG